jgi:hypothetical protein
MPGQWSNFMKNFAKYIISSPETEAALRIVPGITVGYDIFNNLNKLDDPNNTPKDIAVDIAKAIVAPTALIPGVAGTVVNKAANAVIDTASYITDFVEGKKDAPPKPADVNNRSNPAGAGLNNVINSSPFRTFFSRFGAF